MRKLLSLAVSVLAAVSVARGASGQAPASGAIKVPAFQRTVLANGITIVTLPRKDVPIVAFSAIVRGGSMADDPSKAGTASLVAGLLERGAGARTAYQFADAVEGAGGSFSASASSEAILISGQFLARDSNLMVELLADALQRPAFDAEEFDRLRARQIESLKAAKDGDPTDLLRIYGRAALFGAHPYGRPQYGSERSLAAITHDDVKSFYRTGFGSDRLTLIVTGDFDAKALRSAVEKAFSKWQRAAAPLPVLTAAPRITGRRVVLIDQPGASQTYFWLGNVGVARSFVDRPALDIVNTLYGGRFTSILNTELRVKSGLTYGASSSFVRGTVPAEFAIRSSTQAAETERALDLALSTLGQLSSAGVPEDMVPSASAYIRGQYPLQFETAAHWASALTEIELYGLDRSYVEGYLPSIAQVSAADTRRVIGEAFPKADDLVIVLIGDAAKIRGVVKKYGPVTEMPLSAPEFGPS